MSKDAFKRPVQTIGKALTAENNFTLLRLLAAITVLYYHCYHLSLGKGSMDPISRALHSSLGMGLGGIAVGIFFVISGFLVTASFLNRKDLFAYLEARALRIFPGLIVAILSTVFILGSSLTTLPTESYIFHERTWHYIIHNVLLVKGIQYDLPGLFKSIPWPVGVNGSLWTLPVEFKMYIWVAFLGAMGILGQRAMFNLFAVLICLLASQSPITPILKVDGSLINPLFFLIGAFFYVNKDSIPLNIQTLALLGIALLLSKNSQLFYPIKAILFSYSVLLIALLRKLPTQHLEKCGDISYGIYIYAFPVQQACAYLIPGITPLTMLMISLPLTIVFAFLSWHLIEKPCLRLKGKIPLGRRFLDPRVAEAPSFASPQ